MLHRIVLMQNIQSLHSNRELPDQLQNRMTQQLLQTFLSLAQSEYFQVMFTVLVTHLSDWMSQSFILQKKQRYLLRSTQQPFFSTPVRISIL